VHSLCNAAKSGAILGIDTEKLKVKRDFECEVCIKAKMTRRFPKRIQYQDGNSGVDTDICGLMRIISNGWIDIL